MVLPANRGDVKLSLLFLYVLCPKDHFQSLSFFVFGAPSVMAQGALVRQYIGAPMFLSANRQCSPSMVSQLCFADFFSCSVLHYYWRRGHRCAIIIGGL
jgi:hypothetical protein